MKQNDCLLDGIVEIDETSIGVLEKNKHANKKVKNNQGRSTKSKVAVVGLKQRDGQVKVNDSAKEFVNGMTSTNSIESVWALLKRGYHGTSYE